jgi:hypothetical protein
LTLIQADFRDFELPEPARLIAIPFHSIGHMLTREDKLTAFRNIRRRLAPGGRFVFDHFIFDPDYPVPPGMASLRAQTTDPETGRDRLIWETSIRDEVRQVIDLIACTEDLDDHGVVLNRRYRRTRLSWMSPDESRRLLEETGFEIESVYGDFSRAPLSDASPEQVWMARRPE